MPRKSPPHEPRPATGAKVNTLSSISSVELLTEIRRRFGHQLTFLTDLELADELQRRSIGILMVRLRAGEGNRDEWLYRLKGSRLLVSALSAALSMHIEDSIRKSVEEGRS